ncbi:uncharacterized protein LOC142620100 [Castanea sativa]|uniref:uncharacterized protein LOC142620100 n=1 Tax=Castanea sativa TaxID=21020 RepID=UPI003F6533C4
MAWVDNPIVGFLKENAQRFHHPHDDALVVGIRVGDYNTHWVLVDNGSFANILYYLAFQQMRIERERLIPTNASLVRFRGTKVYPFGVVTLPVTVGDYPWQITKDVTFVVVDCSSAYNAILGRPTLNSWKAVMSTYHLMIKFPIEYGVGEMHGDQVAARECYIKKRVFAQERNRAIAEEVRKLQDAEFIKEVYYPDWLANIVMVKKANRKWRMCVDSKDLNKACPKESLMSWQAGGAGIVLHSSEGDKIKCMVRLDFPTANNEAEYEALVAGLDLAKATKAISMVVYYNSQVVTSQVNGDYECKSERMKKYLKQVKRWMVNLQAKFKQIPREENKQTNRFAKAASVEHMLILSEVLSFVQLSSLIEGIDVKEIGSNSN